MSHIFDTLRRVEFERNGTNGRVPSDAVDLFSERRVAAESEPADSLMGDESHHQQSPREQRLRVMGSPLSAGSLREPSYPAPLSIPSEFYSPLPPAPAPISAAVGSPLKVHQEVAAPIPQERIQVGPVEEARFRAQQESPAQVQQERNTGGPVEAAPLRAREEAPVPAQQERSLARPVEAPPQDIPAGVMRTVAVLRAAMPYVQRLLPLLDGNVGTALSNLLNPQPEVPAIEPQPQVDIAPIENMLVELKTQHKELREQAIEQEASLVRIGDHLEMLRNSTDRNTLEQQELIEDLRGVGSKINFVAWVGVGLLAISVAVNAFVYLQVIKFHF